MEAFRDRSSFLGQPRESLFYMHDVCPSFARKHIIEDVPGFFRGFDISQHGDDAILVDLAFSKSCSLYGSWLGRCFVPSMKPLRSYPRSNAFVWMCHIG